jgi:rfaE bifunctional protein nucleotidyltransferase chain/domain
VTGKPIRRCPQAFGRHNAPVNFLAKVLPLERVAAWRAEARAAGLKVVATNGCFDLLHLGHVTYLDAARRLGDCLIVGVNGDEAVRGLKGAGRPLNPAPDRAAVLAALASVDVVTIFPEPDALAFLKLAQPDIYAKGGDYTLDTINQAERRLIEGFGGRVVVLGGVPGRSTTALVERLPA